MPPICICFFFITFAALKSTAPALPLAFLRGETRGKSGQHRALHF